MSPYVNLLDFLNASLEKEQASLSTSAPMELYGPMGYIIGLGGKRIRPLLTLIGCDLFNGDPQQALPAAMAVELFHNFSLIHDDILDKAPLRRGHTTIHEKWNHDIALLSGDGMMVKAFVALGKCSENKIGPLLNVFAKTGIEVCEGQQYDMNFETRQEVSVDDYVKMITFKTAVLLGCSLQMGAICANASEQNQKHLYEFGKHVGIAFQILDDVLDVYADQEKFGKQAGGDIISNKKTFLLLKALELSDTKQKQMLQDLLHLTPISDSEKINRVKDVYDALHIKSIATQEANIHTKIALQHLLEIKAGQDKKANLEQFALQLLDRHA